MRYFRNSKVKCQDWAFQLFFIIVLPFSRYIKASIEAKKSISTAMVDFGIKIVSRNIRSLN